MSSANGCGMRFSTVYAKSILIFYCEVNCSEVFRAYFFAILASGWIKIALD